MKKHIPNLITALNLLCGAYGNDAFFENLWLVTLEYFIIFSFFIWELLKSKNKSIKFH